MTTLAVPEHVRRKWLDDPLIGLPGFGECWLSKVILTNAKSEVNFSARGFRSQVRLSELVKARHSSWCVRPNCPNGNNGITHATGTIVKIPSDAFASVIVENAKVISGNHIVDDSHFRNQPNNPVYVVERTRCAPSSLVERLYINEGIRGYRIITCRSEPGCINPQHAFIIPNNDFRGTRFSEIRRCAEKLVSATPIIPLNTTNAPIRKEPAMPTTNTRSTGSTIKVATRAEYTLPVPYSGRLPVEALHELLDAVTHLPASTPVTFKTNSDRLEAITIIEEA